MSKIDCALVEISLVKIYMFIKIKRWVLKRFVSFRWPEEEELVFRLFPGEPSSSPVLESPGNACQRQILKLHPDLLTQNLGVWDWGILNEYPQCLHTNIRTTGGKEWCRGWGGKGGKELALTIHFQEFFFYIMTILFTDTRAQQQQKNPKSLQSSLNWELVIEYLFLSKIYVDNFKIQWTVNNTIFWLPGNTLKLYIKVCLSW